MKNYFISSLWLAAFLAFITFFGSAPASSSASVGYHASLKRYPYLTDVVASYATVNWGTDRSETAGAVRWGRVGYESCTSHYASASKLPISVNGVLEYQWKAQLDLQPGTQYCYRVYLGTSPANQIDLLGSDPSPAFWTQVPAGSTSSYSFIVFGDWGYVDSTGSNPYQARLMSLMAQTNAHFAVTTGDNGYPDGNQKNLGDLVQSGLNISTIFGPQYWRVPGASMSIFPIMGNHGMYSPDTNHPFLITWPQDRAVSTSGGRYVKQTYCCLNGSASRSYPSAWYAFDAGGARFYLLQTAWDEVNVGTASEYQMDYDYQWTPTSPQYQWLQADLASHPSVLKFAFFHYPLLSDNPFESTDTFLLGSGSLEGLLKQYGVDIAFTGHAHIYERNLASPNGLPNYITGGGGAILGTLGTCTSLDAYAIKFTDNGRACGAAPVPTSPDQVYHFLLVTVNGNSVNVTPINSLGQSFDVKNFNLSTGAEANPPTVPTNLTASVASGTQINLTWSASSDDTGVRGYGVYRDGVLINTVSSSTLSYSDKNLVPGTQYAYRVDAFDGSNNHSALSTSRSPTAAATATYTFAPVADAYVVSDFPGTNYGTSATLKADASPDYHSYMRFNVSDIVGTITNATLRLYTTSSSATGYQVKRVLNDAWEEASVSYSNAPAVGALMGSSGGISGGSWTSVDVTQLITGNGVFGLAITTSSSTMLNFNSRDASANKPQLIIQTTTDVGTPTPTPAVATPTPTSTPSGNALIFAPEADARVSEAAPTTNYGTSTTLQADSGTGSGMNSYIRFTTAGISGPIQSVKLRVYCTTNGTANGPAVYQAANTWTESGTGGITWANQPAILGGAYDNKGNIAVASWVEYDVTALVTGNNTYTFALVADGTDGVTFSSREGSAPPQLVVTLGTGGPTPTPTPTAPAAATPTPTASGGALTYSPTADARVVEASPTTSYGTSTALQASAATGARTTSFIRFSVSSISGTVTRAILRVFCSTNGTANGPAVYLADDNWIETGTGSITWNNQPAIISTASDNAGAIAVGAWVEYDVTALINGAQTYTFALVGDSNDGVTFSSREGSAAPQLIITP